VRYLRTHPLRILATLLVVAFTFFMLSGIPRYRDAKAGVDFALGETFWLGFLVAGLAFVVVAILTTVLALRRRSAA
jgi:hypothetical protein